MIKQFDSTYAGHIDLFLEQLPVGCLVDQRRAEGLDLPRMVAAADTEHHAAVRQDVGHRVVLGEAQRVPHRGDVEAAAELQAFCDLREMHREHEHVGDAFVSLALEMMLRHPEGVIAEPVHELGHGLRFVEHGGEALVGEAAVVHRHAAVAHIVHVDMAGEQAIEFGDHDAAFRGCTRFLGGYYRDVGRGQPQ